MSFPIARLLTDEVTYVTRNGLTDSGDPCFGDPCTVKARVESETRKIIDPEGNEAQANHKIVTVEKIPLDSRLWLPCDDTGDSGACRRPLTVKSAATPGGFRIYETWL